MIPKDPEVPEAVARRMYIRKADITEFGETPGCLGCRCIALGQPLQSHTAACRDRIESCLRETDEGNKRLGKADGQVTEAIGRDSERIMRATSRDNAELNSRRVVGRTREFAHARVIARSQSLIRAGTGAEAYSVSDVPF